MAAIRQSYIKWLVIVTLLILVVANFIFKHFPTTPGYTPQTEGSKQQALALDVVLDKKLYGLRNALKGDLREEMLDILDNWTEHREVTAKPALDDTRDKIKLMPLVDINHSKTVKTEGTENTKNNSSVLSLRKASVGKVTALSNSTLKSHPGYSKVTGLDEAEEHSYWESNEKKHGSLTVIGKYKFNDRPAPTNYPPPKFPGFKITNKDLCARHPTDYVIYVHTAVDHVQNRQVIRKTWGNKYLFKDNRTKTVFFLGSNNHVASQQKLEKESGEYGDIVQGNFLDSYQNLTYKAMVAVRWFKEYCTNVKLIIKTDDDIFLNIVHLMTILEPVKDVHRQVVCPIWQEGSMPILRDPNTCMKWCVKPNEYPGLDGFPRYCSGWAYVYSHDIVDELAVAISHTPFHWIDDAWITGAVLNKLINVNWTDILQYMDGNWPVVYKTYKDTRKPLKIMITHVDANNMHLLWDALVKRLTSTERTILNKRALSMNKS